MKTSHETPDFHVALWAHETFVLDNLPTGTSNKSMPKELFTYGKPLGFAKKFVHIYKDSPDLEEEGEE